MKELVLNPSDLLYNEFLQHKKKTLNDWICKLKYLQEFVDLSGLVFH